MIMTKEQAIQVFEDVANAAQKAGLLSLTDVPIILEAINALKKEEE
jgi:hypothetical protein